MKVLVTGAAGFIGSNLVRALLKEGYTVAGIDNFSQGERLNVAEFAENSKFNLVQCDVLDSSALQEAAKGCKAIYHLAAYKIPRYSNAFETISINSVMSEC